MIAKTDAQLRLYEKCGTPDQMAVSIMMCVPGVISIDEANDAIRRYNEEWEQAGQDKPAKKKKRK
jgi:hypothetical protein